jgi:small-conductance mechanosensitive channel
MKVTQKVTMGALLTLMASAAIGLYLTSRSPSTSLPAEPAPASGGQTTPLNQHYLNTVRRLASTTTTPEEQHAARNAMDAADHELDLQYAYALQLAAIEPVPQTPEIHALQERLTRIKAAIQTRQAEVDQIKNALERVRGARRDSLDDQLDVSQAELNLLQETLADAKDDLIQAGGNPQSRLQELKVEHEAASKAADTFKFPPPRGTPALGSLLARWTYWKSIRKKQLQIQQARKEAFAAAAALARQHDHLEEQLAAEQAQRKALTHHELTPEQIASMIATGRHGQSPAHELAAAPSSKLSTPHSGKPTAANASNLAIALIHRISAHQIMVRILEHRAQAMNDLASAYSKWDSLVASDGRSVLHTIIAGALWVVLIMAVAFLVNRLIEHFLARLSLERRQKRTLQAVLRISVRLVIVVVILMLIFGKPDQLSTVLGLAGAGLAIALQEVILSFLGWFVLMGRYGIRVGDWVEINPNAFTGVRGEVIEITLFRTVLLETGNWNEPGHLTGRQVAFMNMYAVSGYYFNFSTSGQWLWDELQVLIPATRNPYPLVERIRAIVAKETESDTQLAEREWQHISNRYGTKSFSAKPTVNLKATDSGMAAVIRYITRAGERTAAGYRLNHEIVKLFHHGEELVSGGDALADTEAPGSDHL